MSANRLSWIGVGVVVLVVGGLVVRSLRQEGATTAPVVNEARPSRSEAAPGAERPAHDPAATAGSRGERKISSIQRAKILLKSKGFYAGEINGNLDEQTMEAVKKFQTSVGMQPTGYLDAKTYKAMGIEVLPARR
jgi:peptidoglycan hydrolase-like protein with peptidoglycan-binding domain